MSNDYYFRRTAQGKLSQCNRRNTATILRAVVKSHKGIKGKKVFACGCSGRNLNNFPKFTGKRTCRSPFTVMLQPEVAIKSQSNDYSVNFIKKQEPTQRLLHKYFPVNSEKIMNTTLNTSARLSLK